MSRPDNVRVCLLDKSGEELPDSVRSVHNVFTDFGRAWLRELVAWETIDDTADVPNSTQKFVGFGSYTGEARLRWMGLGIGSFSETTSVQSLANGALIRNAPNTFLRELATPVRMGPPGITFQNDFVTPDFVHIGPSIDFTEAGLYVDIVDGGGLGLIKTDDKQVTPVAYVTFPSVTFATASDTLRVRWTVVF